MKRNLLMLGFGWMVVAAGIQIAGGAELATSEQNPPTAQGTIQYGGKTLVLKSAVAWLDEKHSKLKIELFPVALTADQLAKMRSARTSGVVTSQLPSPDPKVWSWCPYASLHVMFTRGTPALNAQTLTGYGLTLHGVDKLNTSPSYSISGTEIVQDFKQLTVSTTTNGVVKFRLKNSDQIPASGWEDAAFDFSVNVKVWSE
jgi:hypothetical protein